MFRRTSSEPETPATDDKVSGKGRPTPTRKEAEAAARARAKVPRTRKEQAAAQRSSRGDTSRRMREAMKTGDDRYLPARLRAHQRGVSPASVQPRVSFTDLMVQLGNTVLFTTLLVIVVDIVMLRFRLRRELARRFPDEPTKGTTLYAAMRSLQMKFLRLPKAQVKIGQKLPESYR